jgi:hypothetical protein
VPWRFTFPVMASVLMLFGGTVGAAWAKSEEASVVILTQVPCQFLESENGVDQNFKSAKKADCEAINRRTGNTRLSRAKPLALKAGNYIFRVTNKSVPYELGFWLRSKDYNWLNPLHKLTKTSVSGGGLLTGISGDYAVTLKPGEYVYSCPLNPTPDYRIVVTE